MAVKEKLSLVDRFKRLLKINRKCHENVISQKSVHEQNLIKGVVRKAAVKKLKCSVQKACRIRNRNK